MTQEDISKRRWKRVIAATAVVLVLFPILAVTALTIFRYRHQKTLTPQTIVPNLKGLDLRTAESRARQAQLNPRVMLRRWDIPAPINTIVGQIPEAGASVPTGTTVGLDLCVEDPGKVPMRDRPKR